MTRWDAWSTLGTEQTPATNARKKSRSTSANKASLQTEAYRLKSPKTTPPHRPPFHGPANVYYRISVKQRLFSLANGCNTFHFHDNFRWSRLGSGITSHWQPRGPGAQNGKGGPKWPELCIFCNAVDCRFKLAIEVQRWTRASREHLPGGQKL